MNWILACRLCTLPLLLLRHEIQIESWMCIFLTALVDGEFLSLSLLFRILFRNHYPVFLLPFRLDQILVQIVLRLCLPCLFPCLPCFLRFQGHLYRHEVLKILVLDHDLFRRPYQLLCCSNYRALYNDRSGYRCCISSLCCWCKLFSGLRRHCGL